MKKSILGLDENVAGALSYVFGFFSGIVVLILEKENKFVRFHALQSTIWSVFLTVLGWVCRIVAKFPLVGFVGGIAGWAVGVVSVVSWVFLIYKAYQKDTFKLPIIGDVVYNQINK
jgi:uncharacterized membrane protein